MASNKPTRRALLGTIGGSLVLAGCVGGDDDDESNGNDSSNDGETGNGDDGTDQPTVQTSRALVRAPVPAAVPRTGRR